MNNSKQWVRDDEKTRGFDGKTLFIKGRGTFVMRVHETNPEGDRRPGYIQLSIEPSDLDTALREVKNGSI